MRTKIVLLAERHTYRTENRALILCSSGNGAKGWRPFIRPSLS